MHQGCAHARQRTTADVQNLFGAAQKDAPMHTALACNVTAMNIQTLDIERFYTSLRINKPIKMACTHALVTDDAKGIIVQ